MRTGEIARQIDGVELLRGDSNVEVDAVVFDSRKAEPRTLFAALRGTHADGHDYLEAAIEQGASAVLVEPGAAWSDADVPVLVAEDTREVLGPVSAAVYGKPSSALELVGVTGTNGKTTTTWMLEQLLAADDTPVGVIGTVSHRWMDHAIPAVNTTPESAETQSLLARMNADGVGRVAMEVSSHGLETHRLGGVHFDVGVFTNLSQDHLDFHGTMEAYRAAKERLFTELLPASARSGKRPVAVVNVDDEAGRGIADKIDASDGIRCVRFGTDSDADFRVGAIQTDTRLTTFCLEAPMGELRLELPLIGDFNVMNATAAFAAATSLGIPPNRLVGALASLPQIPGRMERVTGERGPTVFIDYSHTPDALERALAVLRPLTDGDVVAVFGAGGDRDRSKRPAMGRVAVESADRVFVTSDNPRSEPPSAIIDDILSGCGASEAALRENPRERLVADTDRASAIRTAIATANTGDIVLVAGKGHEAYQEIHGERHPFDDREVARAALGDELKARDTTT
jgi:UDP-N-acetylmuramyl-tripeptide synthetase